MLNHSVRIKFNLDKNKAVISFTLSPSDLTVVLKMWIKAFLTLLGVHILCAAENNQSQLEKISNLPIIAPDGRERQGDTPEVVLQLKYEEGELNKIYLTQFRKEAKSVIPPVPAQSSLCLDLCHGGLGGEACGSTCAAMVPVGLKSALDNSSHEDYDYGHPRVAVCPVLCDNGLGSPLCHCTNEPIAPVNWNAVCNVFCAVDRYQLRGCPQCAETDFPLRLHSARVLNTADGWKSWCNVQCRQGHGGAACNCDRAPFQ